MVEAQGDRPSLGTWSWIGESGGREIHGQWYSPLPWNRNHQLSQQALGRAGVAAFNPSRTRWQGELRGGRPRIRAMASRKGPASRGGDLEKWQALALPGSPLQPASAHQLQGGGWWPAGFKAGPASLTQGSALCSPTPHQLAPPPHRKGQIMGWVRRIAQMSLPAQTSP